MKEIPLINNKGIALVDDDIYDFLMQWKWYLDSDGYAMRGEKGKTIRMHRAIMNAPAGMEVDHINHNKLDNRHANLRICTGQENKHNQIQPKGISQYRGITPTASGKWQAQIKVNGEKIRLGTYATEREAALVRDQAARKYHGEFAILNFP